MFAVSAERPYSWGMRLLAYTLLRLGLIAVWALALYLFGTRGALLWVLAILLGFLTAFLAFRSQADAAAGELRSLLSSDRAPAGSLDEEPCTEHDREGQFVEPGEFQNGDEIASPPAPQDGPGEAEDRGN